MTTINITPMEPNHFGVQIEEGDLTTSHRVYVPPAFLDDLALLDADHENVVRESLGFLLDRVKPTEIPPEVSLEAVAREYPEFYDELRARLEA